MQSQTSRQVAESESHSGCREKQRLRIMRTERLETKNWKKKNHRKAGQQKPEIFRTSVPCSILPPYSCSGEESCSIYQSFDISVTGTDFRSEGKVHRHAPKLKVIWNVQNTLEKLCLWNKEDFLCIISSCRWMKLQSMN